MSRILWTSATFLSGNNSAASCTPKGRCSPRKATSRSAFGFSSQNAIPNSTDRLLALCLVRFSLQLEVFMKRRILLVDDDAAVLLTLKAVLELNQFEIETASSAAEAAKKLRSGVYQMVITDARMETDDAG